MHNDPPARQSQSRSQPSLVAAMQSPPHAHARSSTALHASAQRTAAAHSTCRELEASIQTRLPAPSRSIFKIQQQNPQQYWHHCTKKEHCNCVHLYETQLNVES